MTETPSPLAGEAGVTSRVVSVGAALRSSPEKVRFFRRGPKQGASPSEYPGGSSPLQSLPLLWHGAFLEASGYADEARSYLLALERAGYAAAARENRSSPMDAGATPDQLRAVEDAKKRPLPHGAFTVVHHLVPRSGQPRHDAGPDVARTMFETDRIPRS